MTASRRAHLRRTWDRVRTVPGLVRDVAALGALVAVGLLVAGIILGNQRMNWPWEDSFSFAADFRAVPGISPGNGQEVRIAGVTAGDIRAAEVTEDGRARLTMAIDPKYRIYDNARLILRPKSPLNEMYVEIDAGGPPGRPLRSGQVLPVTRTANPVAVDEVLHHLDDRTRAALTDLLGESDAALAHAPEELPAALSATDGTLGGLRSVAEVLQTRRGKIAELVTALSQIAAAAGEDDERLAALADDMQKTLRVLASRDRELDASLAQVPGFTTELRRATSSVQQLSGQLDPTLDNVRRASGTLPGTLSRLNKTVRTLGETADKAAPVVAAARPVVADLRPLVPNVRSAVTDARAVTRRLDAATVTLLPYLTDLQAFVYNTTSVMSLEDANGGILRGLFQVTPDTVLPFQSR